jgi:hypothetical protein
MTEPCSRTLTLGDSGDNGHLKLSAVDRKNGVRPACFNWHFAAIRHARQLLGLERMWIGHRKMTRHREPSSGVGTPHHPERCPASGGVGTDLFAKRTPNNEERFDQHDQIGEVLDRLFDACL